MILDFSVKNFGPFRDKATLSMQATSSSEHPDNVIETDLVKGGLISSAVIFGANASGKSYFFKALKALKMMVDDTYEEGYTYSWYTPFRLSRDCLESPVELGIRMIEGEILYDYSVAYGFNSVVRESLYYYPSGRRSCVFDRDEKSMVLKKVKKTISDMTSPSSAYLVVASKCNDPVCNTVRRMIRSIIMLDQDSYSLNPSCDIISRDDDKKKTFIEALKIADLGITDIVSNERNEKSLSVDNFISAHVLDAIKKDSTVNRYDVSLKHDFDKYDVDERNLMFPMSIESGGTKNLFELMGPLIDALTEGKVIVIDEFGSNLHSLLTRWIVEQFAKDSNPNSGQLIVNTHDLGLMDIRSLLRRDQIYFTNRHRDTGSSELYSLSDFKGVRSNTDVIKSYLFGRFDAVPNIAVRSIVR